MQYLFIPLVALIVTHLIKFAVFVWRRRNFVGNRVAWSFFWLGGFPSVHSAALASIVYLIGWLQGLSPLFGFAVFVSIIIIYGLLEDNKRQVLYEKYFLSSKNDALIKISKDGVLMDFSGHKLIDVISGVAIGIIVAAVLVRF
jgi:acid phosphatase family membrane protein YuiD